MKTATESAQADRYPSRTVSKRSAQRLFQQRETVGIESHRRLQHRRLDGTRGGAVVKTRIVGYVAMRGGPAPALQHGADEMHVMAGGSRRHGRNRSVAAR